MAIPIVAIVACCTWYFTSRQLAERSAYEDAELNIYGDQFAQELRSAVAFGDRATASEVLVPVANDPDVVATTLFNGDGEILYQSGQPASWIGRARAGVIAKKLIHLEGRSAVVVPVVSLEGPRGTLVIEISTETRFTAQRDLVLSSIGVALVALAFGVLVAWIIARQLGRRLRAIASAAELKTKVDDGGRDEIGVLANAFDRMLDDLAAANRDLEARVIERTAQLETEMKARADMELELRQAQKLESVGRLAAGIAHEINSPVQFVSHSCTFLDEASQSLIQLVHERRRLVADALRGTITIEQLAAQMTDIDRGADVDDLIESIPEASQLVLQGLDRVTKIVRAMKEFAYADQPTQTPSDLNRAIQNTLTVTSNEYKYVADTKVVLGTLPPVTCHVGEINQAVLNIVVNAAHAIEDSRKDGTRGLIEISTKVEGGDAIVAIRDNGGGIPPQILDKIFDPFFTTKEIGRGSGQGLAIARSVIVEKHHGRLDVATKVGEGTTFTIRLPIDGLHARVSLAA